MFKPVDEQPATTCVQLFINEQPVTVPADFTVAAALLKLGFRQIRSSLVGQQPRAPYCMMGVCYECLVEIDGKPAQQACMREVTDGMQIRLHNSDTAQELL